MVIYGTPILYKPDKHYILTVINRGNKGGKRYDMEVD